MHLPVCLLSVCRVSHISLANACTDMGLLGGNLSAEVFYCIVLFTSNDTVLWGLGGGIVAARAMNMLPSGYVAMRVSDSDGRWQVIVLAEVN